MKGKGKGPGCFICGDPNHWSKECPKQKRRMSALIEEEGKKKERKMNRVRMQNGTADTVTSGWMTNGITSGLVLSMTGLVIGPGPKMTGATGPMTGLGVPRIGGVLSNRVLAHCQELQALLLSAGSRQE